MWWIDIGTPEQIERQFLNPFLFLLVHPLGVVISHFQTIPFVHRGKQKAPTLRVMRWEGRRQRPHCLGKNKWGTLNVMIIQRIGFLGKIYGPETHGFWPSKYDGLSGEKMFPSSNCSHPNKGSPHNIWVLYTSLWTWYIMVYHPTFDCILLSYIYIYSIYWYWLVVEPYPSEKWWSSSVGMVIPFPTVHGKSFNPFMETSHHQAVYHQYTNHRLHRLHRYLWWLMVILKSLQAYITIISP